MITRRSINTVFWSDNWVEMLDPIEKLTYLYLLTNERTNMLGIYEISLSRIAFETGLKTPQIESILSKFEKDGKVNYKEGHVILVNFLKHQKFNENMKKGAIDLYNELPNSLKKSSLEQIEERDSEGFETLCKAFETLPKKEKEKEKENEVEKEKENEAKFSFRKSLIVYGSNSDLVDQWIKVRKTKKATNTKVALEGFLNEVEKSEKHVDEILRTCIQNSWSGFRNSWIEKEKEKSSAKKETLLDQLRDDYEELESLQRKAS